MNSLIPKDTDFRPMIIITPEIFSEQNKTPFFVQMAEHHRQHVERTKRLTVGYYAFIS